MEISDTWMMVDLPGMPKIFEWVDFEEYFFPLDLKKEIFKTKQKNHSCLQMNIIKWKSILKCRVS